ncbi:MAG: hypothetical protein ACI8UD_001371 [Planctomycetota bacterium]|jgi:hypothetical protein
MEANQMLSLAGSGLRLVRHLARRILPLCVFVIACVAPSSMGHRLLAQSPDSTITVTRTALAKWVETKRTISAERQAWQLGKQTITSQMEVVARQVKELNERITEANKSIVDAEAKYGELDAERNERKAVSQTLMDRIASLEDRTRKLLPRVPSSLVSKVEPISQRLPTNEQQQKALSLSVRYQNVIGVLNAVDKWNRAITLKSEIRELGSGRTVEVSVLYIGLGQAYYVGGIGKDGKATLAGVGLAAPTGWMWRETNDLAPAIQRAVAIYNNEGLAKLVQLPVQIR